jgi:periplasmic protein TonB
MPRLVVETPRKFDIDDEPTAKIAEKSPEPDSAPPTPEAPSPVQRVAGGPGAGFPDTADFYPSLSIRLEEQGTSVVRVCVDSRGKLSSDPSTVRSSGSARLDEGALRLARAASGHYRPATEDGQPVSSCYPLGIRFQLKK